MEELESLARSVWGAYLYLRDHDLAAISGTSRRLRSGDRAKLKARLLEELEELRGVVEGTHFHEGFEQDLVLEGYEVWYWTACFALGGGLDYDSLAPHRALAEGFAAPAVSRADLLPVFYGLREKLAAFPLGENEAGPGPEADLLAAILHLVGRACRLNEVHPARLLERDRAEMSQKAYLAAYWQPRQVGY